MKPYVILSLKEQKPDIAVIAIGGNYINHRNLENVDVNPN